MVGGTVIGFARGRGSTLLHIEYRGDRGAVRVVEQRLSSGEPVEIQLGDSVWRQGGKLYWTPVGIARYGEEPRHGKCAIDWDIPLPLLDYS